MKFTMMRLKIIKRLWLIAVLVLLYKSLCAQDDPIDSSSYKNQKDMKDVVQGLFKNRKSNESKKNKKIQFAFFPAIGYTSNTGFAIAGGANAVFNMDGAQKESNILTSITYTQFNQTIFPFQVSIWSEKDKFNFILDSRYINYPSSAYGLRGRSKLDSGYSINFSWLKVHPSVLVKISKNLYGGTGLFYDYFWNIKEEGVPLVAPSTNNPLGIATAFEHYTGRKTPNRNETAFGPAFKLLFDSRDNPVNPSKGLFATALFHSSFKSWGSDTSWSSLVVDARKYFSFSRNKESVLALWAYYWQNFGKSSFLLLPSSGWDDFWNTGRGYSQGRYRGRNMRYMEAEYRFQIMKNGLLGGVIFTNLQNFPNELYTSYSEYRGRKEIPVTSLGYGLGLRVKFNKYSKTNVAIDMGFGQDFPRPWLAVNLGEVF
ncbi:MAG TPA: BamA/TamA family outer membrane protein [Puia sp.]|nr:BamA/TamA family outer membrane protein [Puia sp.]